MGASKRLVELLQLLSLRWKVDRATINIYHTYSKCRTQKQNTVAGDGDSGSHSGGSGCPEKTESPKVVDSSMANHSTSPCRGTVLERVKWKI